MKNKTIPETETLSEHINQNGIRPGPRKLVQFKKAMALRGVPELYGQENKGDNAIVYVKIFDPCGSWTWYVTEFSEVAPDGVPNLAFGLVDGFEKEMGYFDLSEMADTLGRLHIGLEIDVHFLPTRLGDIRKGA